jgi:hypothetical protein
MFGGGGVAMPWLLALGSFAVALAFAGSLRDNWSGYRRGERSLATAVGNTCIVVAFAVGGTVIALEFEGQLGIVLIAGVFVLVVIGAAWGAVGLAADRRLRALDREPYGVRRAVWDALVMLLFVAAGAALVEFGLYILLELLSPYVNPFHFKGNPIERFLYYGVLGPVVGAVGGLVSWVVWRWRCRLATQS